MRESGAGEFIQIRRGIDISPGSIFVTVTHCRMGRPRFCDMETPIKRRSRTRSQTMIGRFAPPRSCGAGPEIFGSTSEILSHD